MKTIKRKISILPQQNRFSKNGFENMNDDVVIDEEVYESLMPIADKIPMIHYWVGGEGSSWRDGKYRERNDKEGYEERYVLRYGTMIDRLLWLKNFFAAASTYKICLRGEEIVFYPTDINKIDCSEVHKVCSQIPYFKEVYARMNGSGYTEYDEDGYILVDDDEGAAIYTRADYGNGYDYETSKISYLGKIVIVSDDADKFLEIFKAIDDSNDGLAVCRSREFMNFAKSHLTTFHNNEGYFDMHIMIDCNEECAGNPKRTVEYYIPEKEYYINDRVLDASENLWGMTKGEYFTHIPVPSIICPPIEGKDSSYVIVEDEKDASLNETSQTFILYTRSGNYYFLIPTTTKFDADHWTLISGVRGLEVSGTCKSHLHDLVRIKRDVDDDNVLLPFRVIMDVIDNKHIKVEPEGGLLYDVGKPLNIVKIDGNFQYDCIRTIDIDESKSVITFDYFIGNTVNKIPQNAEDIIYNGVEYTETYPYSKDTFTCKYTVNENTYTAFTYYNIDYTNNLSNFNASGVTTAEPNGHYIMEDSAFGVIDAKIDENIIEIDRGMASAFERHNVLAEISTFEALENYRNGFFMLKGDEN